MQRWIIGLLVANVVLLAWNVAGHLLPLAAEPPPTEPDIPGLELRQDVDAVAYHSGTGLQGSCYTVGPYNSARAAELVAEKVRSAGLLAKVRPMTTLQTLRFFVYIPPLPDAGQAQQVAQDIAKHGVRDVALVAQGPYRNAIALGFFDNLTKAKHHAEYIRYLGYDARYTEEQAAREVFWLDYDEPLGSNIPVEAWSAVADPSSVVQRIPRRCQ